MSLEQSGVETAGQTDLGSGEILNSLMGQLEPLGFKHALITAVPSRLTASDLPSAPVVLSNYPEQWAAEYFSQGQYQQDALMKYAYQHTVQPYQLSDVPLDDISRAERRVLEQGYDFGFFTGVVIPIPMPGVWGLVSMIHEEDDRTVNRVYEGHFQEIVSTASGALNGLLSSRRFDLLNAQFQLTGVEIEVLRLLSQGLTRKEISDRRGTGTSTIDKQAHSLVRKLNARNATHAVALALRCGLID